MSVKIQLTPAELRTQSAELSALKTEYEALFQQILSEMKHVNSNWSAKLAHNFSGKVGSAVRSFSTITQELEAGAKIAAYSAAGFETVDKQLAKLYGGETVKIPVIRPRTIDWTKKTPKKKKAKKKKKNIFQRAYGATKATLAKGKNLINQGIKYWKKGARYLYDNRERILAYGKCAMRFVSGGVKVLGSLAAIATGPVAVVGLISGINDMVNAGKDLDYIHAGDYGMVGQTNALKSLLEKNGAYLGERLFGNAEIGRLIGSATYTGLNAVSFLNSADKLMKSFGKLNTAVTGSSGYSVVWGKTEMADVLNNELGYSKYDIAKRLLGIDPSSTGNFLCDVAIGVRGALKGAAKLGENMAELIRH